MTRWNPWQRRRTVRAVNDRFNAYRQCLPGDGRPQVGQHEVRSEELASMHAGVLPDGDRPPSSRRA